MDIRHHPEGLDQIFVDAPEFEAEFEIYGNCPVQAFGTVRGRDLYFRARNEVWSFEVEDHMGHFPSDGYRNSDGFYREGSHPEADWIPKTDVVAIIERCLREYTAIA